MIRQQTGRGRDRAVWALALALSLACWLGSCSAGDGSPPTPTSTVTTSTTSLGGAGGSGAGGLAGFGTGGAAQVFPASPIIEGSAPANAPALFGDPSASQPSGGPCLFDPEPGALFPKNWLRPRFQLQPAGTQNLFELRLDAASQDETLVVYTDQSSWTMSAALWEGVRNNVVDEPIQVMVRGAEYDAGSLVGTAAIGSTQFFAIAPADAAGTIVYWTTATSTALKGFTVGEEAVATVLEPAQVEMPTTGGADVTCIGCHTSTPDGLYASFTAQAPWANALGSIEAGTVGASPPFLSAAAIQTLAMPDLGMHTYSAAHWSAGNHIQITPWGSGAAAELIWIDLEAAATAQGVAYDVLDRTGDTRGVGSPVWSHDGDTIIYVSTDAELTGRLGIGAADLYSIPYADKQGGAATPITGAAEAGVSEYYPALSADDELLAFNAIPEGDMYDAAPSELYVTRWQGGTGVPVRIAANDPAACTGEASPGVTNSWPKWAPEVPQADGNRYYWLIFSSRRGSAHPQLYITAVVVSAINEITTHGAIYLWNQPAGEANHTPAWDVFQIPPPR